MTYPMTYRVGIDLGTNSLGWAAVRLKTDTDSGAHEAGPLLDMGVRIFSDARNPKNKSSNAAQRREKRGPRKNRDRQLLRKRAMIRELTNAGLFPCDKTTRKDIEKHDPWILRARALDERLEPFEIGRALFHLQQRRGFKSNRKTDGKEDGAMFDAIQDVKDRLYLENARTLGELMGRPRKQQQDKNDDPGQASRPLPQARVKATMTGSTMSYDYYPQRDMILDEFEQIWAAQSTHHADLMTEYAKARIRYVIEHQRPLKVQRVGKCTFIEGEERAPKALPSAQYARILQEVNALRVGAPAEGKRPLSEEERARVIRFLTTNDPKKLRRDAKRTFKQIRDLLHIPQSQTFSHEGRKRDHLQGDLTAAKMMQVDAYGPDWFDLSRAGQDRLVDKLLASEQFEDYDKSGETIEGFGPFAVREYGVDEERARAIFDTRLPDAHGRLSKAALDRLIPHLEEGLRYDEAAKAEFQDHRARGDGEIHDDGLPYYGDVLGRHTAFEKDAPQQGRDTRTHEEKVGRVANPTVHVALNELRKVINDLIRRYGKPEQVVLELARDLPLSDRALRDLESRQKKNQNANDERRAILEGLKQKDTYDNRLKLRLYEEAQEAFGVPVV